MMRNKRFKGFDTIIPNEKLLSKTAAQIAEIKSKPVGKRFHKLMVAIATVLAVAFLLGVGYQKLILNTTPAKRMSSNPALSFDDTVYIADSIIRGTIIEIHDAKCANLDNMNPDYRTVTTDVIVRIDEVYKKMPADTKTIVIRIAGGIYDGLFRPPLTPGEHAKPRLNQKVILFLRAPYADTTDSRGGKVYPLLMDGEFYFTIGSDGIASLSFKDTSAFYLKYDPIVNGRLLHDDAYKTLDTKTLKSQIDAILAVPYKGNYPINNLGRDPG